MDEAYIEFLDNPLDLVPTIKRGEKQNLILMRTFSKIYGLAGTRVGYGIAHPDFITALEKIRQPFNINSLAQAGGLAALDDSEHVRKTRENNAAGKKYFAKELAALGWKPLRLTPISCSSASAMASAYLNNCKNRALLCGRWAVTNCRNGSAFPSARLKKTRDASGH